MVKDRWLILKRYMKSWFWLDLVTLGMDWIGVLGKIIEAASAGDGFAFICSVRKIRALEALK